MSNPYDPNSNPYGGSEPASGQGGYGAPGQGGYGAPGQGDYGAPGGYDGGGYNPYGAPGGGYEPPKKTDAVSIIAFVLSLTCCLSVVGAIMGFIGLGRTKNGQRKGRWAAIAGIIIGIIGTLVVAGVVIFVVWLRGNSVLPSNASEGQCVNVSLDDEESVLLLDTDCAGDHDAEVTWVGTFSEIETQLGEQFTPQDINDITDSAIEEFVCSSLTDPAYVAALGDGVEFSIVREDTDPSGSDPLMCYASKTNDQKFTEHVQP